LKEILQDQKHCKFFFRCYQ